MAGVEGTTDGVLIALITTVGLVVVALITAVPAWITASRTKKIHENVGEKNGQGTVIEVAEKALAAAERAEAAAAEAVQGQKDHADADVQVFTRAGERFSRLEQALGIEPGPPLVDADS